jgi:carbon monoxide dehydrogenase subunit G
MARFAEVIEVSRPLEQAFAYVADFTTAAEWDPGIVSSRRTSGDGGVGTTYAVDAEFRGKTLPFAYTVTVLEPNRRIVLHGEGDKATSDDDITFEPTADGGTRITYDADLRLKGVLRLAEPFLAGAIRTMGAKALAGLKAVLDAHDTATPG